MLLTQLPLHYHLGHPLMTNPYKHDQCNADGSAHPETTIPPGPMNGAYKGGQRSSGESPGAALDNAIACSIAAGDNATYHRLICEWLDGREISCSIPLRTAGYPNPSDDAKCERVTRGSMGGKVHGSLALPQPTTLSCPINRPGAI